MARVTIADMLSVFERYDPDTPVLIWEDAVGDYFEIDCIEYDPEQPCPTIHRGKQFDSRSL